MRFINAFQSLQVDQTLQLSSNLNLGELESQCHDDTVLDTASSKVLILARIGEFLRSKSGEQLELDE